jgi:hypothetical protein
MVEDRFRGFVGSDDFSFCGAVSVPRSRTEPYSYWRDSDLDTKEGRVPRFQLKGHRRECFES